MKFVALLLLLSVVALLVLLVIPQTRVIASIIGGVILLCVLGFVAVLALGLRMWSNETVNPSVADKKNYHLDPV